MRQSAQQRARTNLRRFHKRRAAARLRQAGSVQELLARARQALDLVENLAAQEAMHGAEARALLAQSPAPQGAA